MSSIVKVKDIAYINPKSNVKRFEYINYIDTSSVYDGSLLSTQFLDHGYPSRAQRELNRGDILISSVRPCLKHNYLVKTNLDNLVGSSGFIQIRCKSSRYLNKYLYYFLTSDKNVAHYDIVANFSQTAFPTFNKDLIEELVLPNVSLEEQHHIVNTISSLLLKSL